MLNTYNPISDFLEKSGHPDWAAMVRAELGEDGAIRLEQPNWTNLTQSNGFGVLLKKGRKLESMDECKGCLASMSWSDAPDHSITGESLGTFIEDGCVHVMISVGGRKFRFQVSDAPGNPLNPSTA